MKTAIDLRPVPPAGLPGKPASCFPHTLRALFERTASLAAALREALARRRATAAARRQLDSLDERGLKDIGLHRGELESLAAELDGLAAPTRRHATKSPAVAPLY